MTITTTFHTRGPRRHRAAALVAVGALALLSACESDDAATPATAPVTSIASDTTAPAADPTTTTTMRGGPGTTTTTAPIGGDTEGDDTPPIEEPWVDVPGDSGDEEAAPGGAFADGHWEVDYSTDYVIGGSSGEVSVDAALQMYGSGTLDIEAGKITAGTVDMLGPGDGTVTTAGVDAVVDGDYWIRGTVDGTTATPTMHASSGFTGTVTTGGRTIDSDQDFGVFTGDGLLMVIRNASETMVTGDWVQLLPRTDLALGFEATLVGAFTATRTDECAATGPMIPPMYGRIAAGTVDAPTVVALDVDPSVADDDAQTTLLRAAVEAWNSALRKAGIGVAFDIGPAVEGSPVVHVGIDDPKYVGIPVMGGALEQVDPAKAVAEFQVGAASGGGKIPYVTEGYLRLVGHPELETWSDAKTWAELAVDEPATVLSTFEHELGHALGLKHSKSATSVMNGQGDDVLGISCEDMRSLGALYRAE